MGLPTEQLGQMGQFGVNAAKLGELLGYR